MREYLVLFSMASSRPNLKISTIFDHEKNQHNHFIEKNKPSLTMTIVVQIY